MSKLRISLTLSAEVVALVDRDARRRKDTRSGVVEQWLRGAATARVEEDIEAATVAYYRALQGPVRTERSEASAAPRAPRSKKKRRVTRDEAERPRKRRR